MRWMLHRQHANISHMQFNAFLFLQIFNLSLTADKGADDVSIHHPVAASFCCLDIFLTAGGDIGQLLVYLLQHLLHLM